MISLQGQESPWQKQDQEQPEVSLCELLIWHTLLGLQSTTAKISVFSLMVTNTNLLTPLNAKSKASDTE